MEKQQGHYEKGQARNKLQRENVNSNDNEDKNLKVSEKINESKQIVPQEKPGDNIECQKSTVEKQPIETKPSYTQAQIQLKKQLQSMEFEQYLIEEAILQTSNLEKAIEFIISQIQANEQQQMIGTEANQVKVYFIVRMDLKMGTGKIAAQVGHAMLKAFQQMRYSASINDKNAGLLIEWMQNGKKIKILQTETEQQIRGYLKQASEKAINHCYIRDAGRTQIAAGSMTVGAIGPVRECDVGFLKKLNQL